MALNFPTVEGMDKISVPLPRGNATSADGLQDAHIYGQAFWRVAFGDLLNLIDPNGLLDVDHPRNGFHAPESKAGGMALELR
jgi:hypothetical protein